MYGEPIGLTFKGQDKYTTNAGGCLTILTFVVFLVLLVTVASQPNPEQRFADSLTGTRIITDQVVQGSARSRDIGFSNQIELEKIGDTL